MPGITRLWLALFWHASVFSRVPASQPLAFPSTDKIIIRSNHSDLISVLRAASTVVQLLALPFMLFAQWHEAWSIASILPPIRRTTHGTDGRQSAAELSSGRPKSIRYTVNAHEEFRLSCRSRFLPHSHLQKGQHHACLSPNEREDSVTLRALTNLAIL